MGVSPAQAAQPDESADPHVALLSEYDRYWTPKPFDKQNFDTAFRGDVTPQARRSWLATTRALSRSTRPGLTRRTKPLTDRADPSSGVPCAMPRCLRTRCKKITIPSAGA
ncbi:acid phosphatase [Cutibacterium acnes JCM 18918]|nr:acid phosphatase [Cutibacterium acnes JCM 18918]